MDNTWFVRQCDSPHIGDWLLLVIEDGKTEIPGRVVAVDHDTITIEDEHGEYRKHLRSCYMPIPIRKELLLANGFQFEKKIEPNVVRYIRTGYNVAFIVALQYHNDKFYMLQPAANNPRAPKRFTSKHCIGKSVPIQTVHELQHYLMWLDNKRFFNLKLRPDNAKE